jgi:hypothetical protein
MNPVSSHDDDPAYCFCENLQQIIHAFTLLEQFPYVSRWIKPMF